MQWNDHSRDIPEGSHAFLSPSKYSWINYSKDQLISAYVRSWLPTIGTLTHEFAKDHIKYGYKLVKSDRKELSIHLLKNGVPNFVVDNIDICSLFENLQNYVNDAIGYRMRPEQPLKYSENCFGTADAISFDEDKKKLRIHDLKTGVTPASLHQLEIYTALCCMEYDIKPGDVDIELRIYQNNDILVGLPTAEDVVPVIDKIETANNVITSCMEV